MTLTSRERELINLLPPTRPVAAGTGPLADWSGDELALAAVLGKVGDLPVPDRPDKASTLYLTAQLTRQIQGYQRELDRIWDQVVNGLEDAAGDAKHNQITGHSEGDERARAILAMGVAGFTAAAAVRFVTAWDTGRDLALEFMQKDRLIPAEQQALIQLQLGRNRTYVEASLFADARDVYGQAIRDPSLSPEATAAQVKQTGESMFSRVAMYAVKLWGLAHLAFGKELMADGRPMRWVLTSLKPCIDCPRLARGGPYSIIHPLPTVPGLGDTICAGNCLCMLKEDDVPGKLIAMGGSLDLHAVGKLVESVADLAQAMRTPPAIQVAAPVVHVAPPDVTVHVAAPEIAVHPDIHVELPKATKRQTKRTITRDAAGEIASVLEEEL